MACRWIRRRSSGSDELESGLFSLKLSRERSMRRGTDGTSVRMEPVETDTRMVNEELEASSDTGRR